MPIPKELSPALAEPLITGGLLASYLGVIASLLLAFSTITLNVLMFAALALLLAPSAQVWSRPLPKLGRQVLALGGGAFTLIFVYLWGRYVGADWQIQAAQNAMAQGDLPQAVADLRQAVAGNPYERVYRLSLSYGLALDGAQQQGAARTALFMAADKEVQQALHQGPVGDVVLVRAVDTYTYLAEQDRDRYAPVLGKLLEQGNALVANSANMTRSLALYYLTYGDKDQAKTAFDRLVRLRPLAGDSYLQRAKWDEKYGSANSARQDLTKAIRLTSGSTDPVYQQAKDQLKQHESKSNH